MFVHRWLASNGQLAAAEQALRSLRGPADIEADVSDMQQAVEAESKLQSWTLLRFPAVRAELKLGESSRCPQQLLQHPIRSSCCRRYCHPAHSSCCGRYDTLPIAAAAEGFDMMHLLADDAHQRVNSLCRHSGLVI